MRSAVFSLLHDTLMACSMAGWFTRLRFEQATANALAFSPDRKNRQLALPR
jgi:preprotein translocase subunit SecF